MCLCHGDSAVQEEGPHIHRKPTQMISLGLLEVFSTLCGFAQSIPRDHLCCVVPDHIIFFKYMEPSGTDVKVCRT